MKEEKLCTSLGGVDVPLLIMTGNILFTLIFLIYF